MHTMTCHHCQQPVRRCDAALRSISLELAAFHPACLAVEYAVDEVLEAAVRDPEFVIAVHTERVA